MTTVASAGRDPSRASAVAGSLGGERPDFLEVEAADPGGMIVGLTMNEVDARDVARGEVPALIREMLQGALDWADEGPCIDGQDARYSPRPVTLFDYIEGG